MAMDRRRLLAAGALGGLGAGLGASGVAGGVLPVAHAAPGVPRPSIHPRSDWARRPGPTLTAEEVRFLLVHHSQTRNGVGSSDAPAAIRSMHGYHTSAEKGWPDVAYNFLIDADGGIWEGRSGSLAGPVRGDATGGSQGFAQLVCLIGDFTSVEPTPAALDALTRTCAWLASRYSIDLARQVTFASRGSNRWPKGTIVTTDPIAAHRDMSRTECPGDALYPLVRSRVTPEASRLVAASGGPGTPEPSATATPSEAPASPGARPGPASTSPTSPDAAGSTPPLGGWLAAGAAGVGLVTAGVLWRRRRAG